MRFLAYGSKIEQDLYYMIYSRACIPPTVHFRDVYFGRAKDVQGIKVLEHYSLSIINGQVAHGKGSCTEFGGDLTRFYSVYKLTNDEVHNILMNII